MEKYDDSLVSEEKEYRDVDHEMVIENVPTILLTIVDSVAKSVCKIKVPSKGKMVNGSGFFGVTHLDNELRYGLFTCNHVIGQHNLSSVDITYILGKKGEHEIQLPIESYSFTNEELDATFIEVTHEKRQEIENKGYAFMQIGKPKPPVTGEGIFIVQHPRKGLEIATGVVQELLVGRPHFYHTVSTHYGSSGSPVTKTDGSVIGIHRARKEEWHCNKAVQMASVVEAIRKHIKSGQQNQRPPAPTTVSIPNGNIALESRGATAKGGFEPKRVIDGKEWTGLQKGVDWQNQGYAAVFVDESLTVELDQVYLLNFIQLHLLDCYGKEYMYYLEISDDNEKWTKIHDQTNEWSTGVQEISFQEQPVQFIKITPTNVKRDKEGVDIIAIRAWHK